jgi:fluoride ion exporter CrcB/FEX
MKAIIKHMNTDPNAEKHVELGQLGSTGASIVVCLSAVSVPYSMDAFILSFLVAGLIGSFITGILIELVQRWQRRDGWNFFGASQNSIKESCMDALVTGLWPLWYFK